MKRKQGRKKHFSLTAAVLVCIISVALVAVAGIFAIRYLKDYLKYAGQKGTGIVLERDGLSGLLDWIGEKEEVPEHSNVSLLSAELCDRNGEVYSFTLSMEAYDADDEYIKDMRYQYDSQTGKLDFSEDGDISLATLFDPNAETDYLDGQFRKIPFTEQMKKLDFERYTVEFQKDRKVQEKTAVIDGRDGNGFPVLTWKEYQQGAGGGSDGSSQVAVALTDGTGAVGKRIEYICPAAEEESLEGSPETVMKTDYKIEQDELKLTDNSGETWISSGLTPEQVQETLSACQSGQEIPENSFCSDGNGKFALFYGAEPVLRVFSESSGEYRDIPFHENFPRICKARVIRFLDENNWYAALGTDWSMGTGGATLVYWSHDAGETWQKFSVPDKDGLILTGIEFADQTTGILTMEDCFGNESWPHVYLTENGGMDFTEIQMDWDAMTGDVMFLNKVDSLEYKDGTYTLILGQGSYGNKKVKLTSDAPGGPWTLTESYIGTVHTWG